MSTQLQAACDAGRKDLNPWQRITSPFSRMVSGDDIPWRVHYDDAKVAAVLQDWEAKNVTGFTAGDVTFNGTTVVKVEPVVGKTVDADAARGAGSKPRCAPARDAGRVADQAGAAGAHRRRRATCRGRRDRGAQRARTRSCPAR